MTEENEKIASSRGRVAVWGLDQTRLSLELIQAAILLLKQGKTRATASEIVDMAFKEFGTKITPSKAGHIISSAGLQTVVIHGNREYALDEVKLENRREGTASRVQELTKQLEWSIEQFHGLSERIHHLRNEWLEIWRLKRTEKMFIQVIEGNRETAARLNALQAKAKDLQQQRAQADALEKEIQSLSETIKQLPLLKERKAALEARISQYQQEDNNLLSQEAKWNNLIEYLKQRQSLITLATITGAINAANQELAQITQQINAKRTLLDKMLHRQV